jgi:hypothetical protein
MSVAQLSAVHSLDEGFGSVRKPPSWLRLSFDIWGAGLEAQQVIGLRLAKLAGGGAAAAVEVNRMVSEKMTAALEAQQAAMRAMLAGNATQIPLRTLALYRRKMRANRTRLRTLKSPSATRSHRSKKPRPT